MPRPLSMNSWEKCSWCTMKTMMRNSLTARNYTRELTSPQMVKCCTCKTLVTSTHTTSTFKVVNKSAKLSTLARNQRVVEPHMTTITMSSITSTLVMMSSYINSPSTTSKRVELALALSRTSKITDYQPWEPKYITSNMWAPTQTYHPLLTSLKESCRMWLLPF